MLRALRAAQYIQFNELDTKPLAKPLKNLFTFKNFLKVIASEALARPIQVECNLCGWRGHHFVDFYSGYGHVYPNSICPHCYSHPRHRAYSEYLKHLLKPIKNKIKVLHFSPELAISNFIQSYDNVDYLSVDLDFRKAMRKEDIKNLSFKDNSFDLIICIHVFEHIDDDKKAMQEVYRVLKKGGFAVLDVPIDENRDTTYEDPTITSPEARTKAFWQWDHLRLYGKDYGDKLRSIGFNVQEDDYIKSLGDDKIRYFGLSDSVSYLCSK